MHKSSTNEFDTSFSTKRMSHPFGHQVSIKDVTSMYDRRKSRDEGRQQGTFYSTYKPLQDITLKSQGEKCFILLDKRVDVSNSENKKEKLVQAESGLLLLMEVSDSKKNGVKHVSFNSLIQVKSELDFNIKIELDCENLERTVLELNPCKLL